MDCSDTSPGAGVGDRGVADVGWRRAILARVGANIADRRGALGLTQRELAAKAGVDRAFLNGVERGRRNPTMVVVAKLAHALGTTTSGLTDNVEIATNTGNVADQDRGRQHPVGRARPARR